MIVLEALNTHNRMGGAEASCFGSFAVKLQPDESVEIPMPIAFGHVMVASQSTSDHGMAWIRGSAALKYAGGNKFEVMVNTPLTGTTGEVGKTTISTNANKFYLENRSTVENTLAITFIGIHSNRD